jgi:PAS domain-containing protein
MQSLLPWIQELRGVSLGEEGPEFSADSLRLLLENLPVAVSITAGPEHRFAYANRLYREILQPLAVDPDRGVSETRRGHLAHGLQEGPCVGGQVVLPQFIELGPSCATAEEIGQPAFAVRRPGVVLAG